MKEQIRDMERNLRIHNYLQTKEDDMIRIIIDLLLSNFLQFYNNRLFKQMKPKAVKKTEGKPKKDKSQSKRMKTFNSSQFQLWEQKNKAMKASATDLTILKQQTISNRREQNKLTLSQYNGSKGNTTKITMKKKKKTVITKSKAKLKKFEEQQFQKVKYKQSNSHSQIVFSNDETKRESCMSNIELKNVKHIQSISNYQYDSNLILRVNIKRQYVRKVDAATKIQKVFRGYMTRKILMKYIKDEQQRLKSRLADNLNSDFDQVHQNQTNRTFVDKEGEYLLNRLFENRAIGGDNNVNHMKARVQDLQQSSQEEQEDIQGKLAINQNYPRRKQDNIINFASQGKSWVQRQNEEQEQQQSESEEEDQGTDMIYKRQNPIYSQQQISHYLESSEQECQQELQDAYEPDIIFQTNEEYLQSRKSSLQNKNQTINKLSNKGISDLALIGNFDERIRKQLRDSQGIEKIRARSEKKQEDKLQNIKQKEIQFQSAKGQKLDVLEIKKNVSQQQKQKQKISKINEFVDEKQQNNVQKIQEKMIGEVNSVNYSQEKQNTDDKIKQNEDVFETIVVDFHDQQTNQKLKLQDENNEQKQPNKFEKLHIPEKRNEQIQQKSQRSSQTQKQKQQFSPRRDVKYLDEQYLVSNQSSANSCRSNRSKKSVGQEQIIKLRELQCEKWDEVIRMVSQQIRKNEQNNGQIVNFMKTIMEFSQKNKQLLGSTRSVNSQSEAFTTPTSMGAGFFNSIEPKDRSNEEQILDSGQKSDQMKNQASEDNSSGFKFFKKKKPLKIELSDDNIFEDQKETILFQISESKKQNNKFDFPKQKQFVRTKAKNQQFIQKSPIYRFHKNEPLSLEEKKILKNDVQNMNQNSKTLKNFLTSNIQVQDDAINDILKLREELLQKRQSQELIKLNKQLSTNQLTQQQFLQKLSNMTRKFHEQKQMIDKAKQDIIKGYQAANDLVKQYFYDVRRMGIKLAVSRSQDNIKYKFTPPSYFNGQIKIDELTPKSTPKSTPKAGEKRMSVKEIFAQHQIYEQKSKQKSANLQNSYQQSSEDSIQFTEQQLKRFRKAANYDLEFNDLNRNMTTISDQFIKQQKKPFHDDEAIQSLTQSPQSHRVVKGIQPQRQTYLLQDQKAPSTRTPPHIEAVIQNEINILVWQFATQLLLRPIISDKFVDKASLIRPAQITHEQRLEFLTILQQNLPDKSSLHRKLNQNITPLPSEILKCMRLDFSEEDPGQEQDDDDNYEQINKYQFVISQQSCAKSVMLFKNSIDQAQQLKEIDQIRKKNEMVAIFEQNIKNTGNQQKIQRYVNQRQTFLRNRKQHTRQLRWQVMNIQLHCIFDSWNEQIIQLCSQRSGFSGIGLNQLTLSMINHNKPVAQDKCQNVVLQAKQKVVEILVDDTDLNAKVLRENFHEMCQNDSAWVFYADEALSYALELVYLIQEDIYAEVARQFRKIIMKSSFAV